MEDILIGTTDRSILVFIPDPASTTGAGKTGLAAADITVTYTRVETDNDVVHNDVTSSLSNIALTDAHTDWGWEEVNATLSKGLYRLDLADAVFASGAWYAVVQVTITSGTAAATPKAFRLVARNDLDGVRLGLTALPNASADAAGGLPISDAGGLDLDGRLDAAVSSRSSHSAADVWAAATRTLTSFGALAPTNFAAMGIEADGMVHSDLKEWLGVAPLALVSQRVASIAQVLGAGSVDATAMASSALNAIADALLDRNMATGTDSGTETIRTVRQALRVLRNMVDLTTGEVFKEDDTTPSWTFSLTRAAGNPITVFDPSS